MKAPHKLHLSAENMNQSKGRDVDEQLIDTTIRTLLESDVSAPRQQANRDCVQEREQGTAPIRPDSPVSASVRRSFLGNPPGWRVSLVILVLAILIGWPILLLVFFGLLVAILVIPYLTLGHDRSVEICLLGYDLLSRHSPSRAEYLRGWAARQTSAMERWLTHLPESWVSGLYLPDFETDTGRPEKMQTDPFDRLYERLRSKDAES